MDAYDDGMQAYEHPIRGARGMRLKTRIHQQRQSPERHLRARGINEGETIMDKYDEITIQESVADEITEAIKGCYDILFNVCVAFGMDWKPYCAALMRDLADHVEL